MRHLPTLLLLALLPVFSQAGEVYRCAGGDGSVEYSDKPCPNGEKLAIESRPTDREAVEERSQSRKEQIEALDTEKAREAERAAEARQQAEQRRRQCTAARERLAKLSAARRMTTGEGDETRYLEDAEMIERRQKAQDEVNRLCSN